MTIVELPFEKKMKKVEVTCPITATMNIIGGKWKPVILWYLKDLEKEGIVRREVFAEVPPKVEYSLTAYGKTLIPVIITLRQWGVKRLLDFPELMKDNEELQHFMKVIAETENLSFEENS